MSGLLVLRRQSAQVAGSGKFVLLAKLLPRLQSEHRKVLIFSQFVRLLHLLADFCRDRGFDWERLDGTVKMAARQRSIDRFNDPKSSAFACLREEMLLKDKGLKLGRFEISRQRGAIVRHNETIRMRLEQENFANHVFLIK